MSVLAVCISPEHHFSKTPQSSITLIANLGVQDDCHAGKTVQHCSRLHIQPAPPNLRQVHLMPSELLRDFQRADDDDHEGGGGRSQAYNVQPGDLGENITTAGIDLLALSTDTRLHFVPPPTTNTTDAARDGDDDHKDDEPHLHPVVRVTGLRNPCPQIDGFQKGLRERCLVRDDSRSIVARKAGVMGVVEVGGEVRPGWHIVVEEPEGEEQRRRALECV